MLYTKEMKILVVDDDKGITDFLKAHLPKYGFAVDVASNGTAGIACLRLNVYDLVICDINLPDIGGESLVDVVSTLEEVPPILILTVITSVTSKIRFLNAGADDYIVKPFRLEELVARIRALLRRSSVVIPAVLSIGDLTINTSMQMVYKGKQELHLTRKEFALLEYLVRNKGRVLSKETLIEHLWNSSSNAFSFSLDTHIYNLRKKLGISEYLKTVHSRGYRMG